MFSTGIVLFIVTLQRNEITMNQEKIFNQHTLPNGLRIIQTYSETPVAYCGFAIDAGTRDEEEQEQGMAHFVEHLIFKGTTKRKASFGSSFEN